jgi:hypothetical protein
MYVTRVLEDAHSLKKRCVLLIIRVFHTVLLTAGSKI